MDLDRKLITDLKKNKLKQKSVATANNEKSLLDTKCNLLKSW